jgi:phosphohistidine swiveling domain-containing protein
MRDPLNDTTEPNVHWTTANIGEALPGVLTPLSWSLWGPTAERTNREAIRATGAFTKDELPFPVPDPPDDRNVKIFYGRASAKVNALVALGDRLPGTSGEQVALGVLGGVPADMTFAKTRRHYPRVLLELTRQNLTISRRLHAAARRTEPWWQDGVQRAARLDTPDACAALFAEAAERFYENVLLQTICLLCAVQPMYDAVTRLAAKAGLADPVGLTTGYGGAPEAAIVTELWRCSRGELTVEEIVRRFGHHGPREGELSGTVWREDDTPLRRMIDQYRARPDHEDPTRYETGERRRQLESELLEGLPRLARAPARLVLARAAQTIPLRGAAKDAFLQAFDVARAAARRAGELYATSGELDQPGDVFFLTSDELHTRLPDGLGEVIVYRRARFEEYQRVRLPRSWSGTPVPTEIKSGARPREITGVGVSPGQVEGVARVVTDPAFTEVEPGEILVSATTDPSWASIMFLSSALVVDIGGHLSHAAVVARELGIPCVVNTVNGSDALKTGDHVRVNGNTGRVTILTPTDHVPPQSVGSD